MPLPDQNLEPPDEYQHYPACDAANDLSLRETCICDEIEASHRQDWVDRTLQRRKDEDLDF
jgi:hypothetical protein